MTFRILALEPHPFEPLFALSDAELAARRAVRATATAPQSFPCRVSLVDAEPGEELILVNHRHQAAASPYRSEHAIFVRRGARQPHPAVGDVPAMLRRRVLSLRAFDSRAMIVAADLVDGRDLEPALGCLLSEPATDIVHIHFAKYGCYAARAERA